MTWNFLSLAAEFWPGAEKICSKMVLLSNFLIINANAIVSFKATEGSTALEDSKPGICCLVASCLDSGPYRSPSPGLSTVVFVSKVSYSGNT